jgi:hypothetical protein
MTTVTESAVSAALADVLRVIDEGKTPTQEDDEWTCEELREQAALHSGKPVTYNQMAAILRAQVAAGKLSKREVRARTGRNAQAFRAA